MQVLVIYPGRFQPPHRGHAASYEALVNKFGQDNVYVVTSNVTAPVTNPFNFADKTMLLTKLGIPAGKIAQVQNPYQAQEIVRDVPDPENTALIFAVSNKDMAAGQERFKFGTKKNGQPSYMQPYPKDGKKLQALTKHAYVYITPTVNFKVRGADANSASTIRNMYIKGNQSDRRGIIHDLYGIDDATIKNAFDKKLLPAEKLIKYGRPSQDGDQVLQGPTLQKEHKIQLKKLLESAQHAEMLAAHAYRHFKENLITDYLEEKNRC